MALPVLPPDMVSAGVTPAPREQDAPTQSTLPAPAVQQMQADSGLGLMRMLHAPAQLPNPGLAVGAGVLDSLAGVRGGNTYLAQHQQQVAQQSAQQLQQVQLMDRIADRRRQQEEKQDAALMELLNGFKDSDDPRAQEVYGLEMSRRAKSLGRDITPEFFAQTAKIGKEELDLINGDIVAGLPPEQIIARHPKVARMSPSWLKDQIQVLQTPVMRAKLGYKTDEELQADARKRTDEQTERDLKRFRTLNPEVTDEQAPHVAAFVRSKTSGPLQGMDTSTPEGRALLAQGLTHANRQIDLAKERDVQRKAKGEAGPKLSDDSAIRQQFNGLTKDFVTVRDSYQRIGEAAKTPSAAGDLALIFNYMKMLDPNSVVRESEFATAAAAGGYGDRIQAAAQRVLRGERLSEEMRRDFLSQAQGQFNAQRKGYLQTEKEYRKIATISGMDPDRAVPDHLGDLRGPLGARSNTQGTRRIRVRDNKTNKIHEAELGPGDMVPPGYTEIK